MGQEKCSKDQLMDRKSRALAPGSAKLGSQEGPWHSVWLQGLYRSGGVLGVMSTERLCCVRRSAVSTRAAAGWAGGPCYPPLCPQVKGGGGKRGLLWISGGSLAEGRWNLQLEHKFQVCVSSKVLSRRSKLQQQSPG